jgi:hypothetical protein
MGALLNFLVKMEQLDRRYIFVVIALAVVIPFLAPVQFHARPSEETIRFDEALDRAISDEKPVMLAIDFGTQTMAEMEPIALAVLHKLFARKKQTIILTLVPETPPLVRRYLASMEKQYGLEYGKDYVFLGLATAYTMAIYNMGTSIEEYYHEDDRGTPYDQIPLLENVKNLKDVAAVINIASNVNPQHWINYAVTPFDLEFLMSVTAVQATNYFPYLQTGQVDGLIAGGKAGAEFEGMLMEQGVLAEPGDATRGLGSQSLALLTIIALIILGNIGYFARRRKEAGAR